MEDVAIRLRETIREMTARLEEMGDGPDSVEEFTIQGNAVRRCGHLEDVNRVQHRIIDAYAEYAAVLEETVWTALSIQREITGIMKQCMAR